MPGKSFDTYLYKKLQVSIITPSDVIIFLRTIYKGTLLEG